MSELRDVAEEYTGRDLKHWTEWHDSELIDQAACGCQERILLDNEYVREAIALNVIEPFRQKTEDLAAQLEQAQAALRWIYKNGLSHSTGRPADVNMALSDAFKKEREKNGTER